MKTGKGAGAPSRPNSPDGRKNACKEETGDRGTDAARPETEAERLPGRGRSPRVPERRPEASRLHGACWRWETSIASGTAVLLARLGKRVLLVSMDPDMNLAELFNEPIGSSVTRFNPFRVSPPSN